MSQQCVWKEKCEQGARGIGDLQIEYDILGLKLKSLNTKEEIDNLRNEMAENRANYFRLLFTKTRIDICSTCPLRHYG